VSTLRALLTGRTPPIGPSRARKAAAAFACAGAITAFAFERSDAARPLADQVLIRRDVRGVPHILAESEEAAAFGLGYAQAEDHAEALGRRFLRGRGVAARHFGESGKESDFAMGRLDNYREAQRAANHVGRSYRKVIRAFAAGINLYARQQRARLPEWMPEVDEADVLANGRAGAVEALASPALVARLERKYAPGPGIPTAAEQAIGDSDGSNAVAIGPSRSASGRALLLGNPHLRWSSLYWEAHVTVPGRVNFYGSTLVGIPWLRAGFNDVLGYVQTNNAPDLADVYALTLDAGRPDHYVFEGRSRPLERREVAVEIRGDDGVLRREARTYWSSHLGPIVWRTADRAFAYRSVALEAWRYFEGFYELTHARSLREFERLLARQLVPTSNFTYADVHGNVLYRWNARLPRRLDDGMSYELDVPGGAPKYLWRGLHRSSDLPRVLNPRSGYLQNANNPPWFSSTQDRLDEKRFPSYIERGELSLRAQKALKMLEARERLTPDDLLRLKFDNRILAAERLKPALLSAVRAQAPASADLQRGAEVLESWDDRVDAGSRGAVLFQRFLELYLRGNRKPFAVAWDPARPLDTPSGLQDPQKALDALGDAVRQTRADHGSEAVAWGEVNRFRFGEVDLPGDGASGQLGAYRVMQFDPRPDKKRVAGWGEEPWQHDGFGDAWILLVEFGRPVRAWSVLAYGQTTDRASIHARDQIRLFANHELRPVYFAEAEIAAHLEASYRPSQRAAVELARH
jgi:acyl-homoserine-lactone acylase